MHILFAGERAKPRDAVPAPDVAFAERIDGYQTMGLDRPIAMKLTANGIAAGD